MNGMEYEEDQNPQTSRALFLSIPLHHSLVQQSSAAMHTPSSLIPPSQPRLHLPEPSCSSLSLVIRSKLSQCVLLSEVLSAIFLSTVTVRRVGRICISGLKHLVSVARSKLFRWKRRCKERYHRQVFGNGLDSFPLGLGVSAAFSGGLGRVRGTGPSTKSSRSSDTAHDGRVRGWGTVHWMNSKRFSGGS